MRRAFDPVDVLPRLARLARLAPASSEDGVFAHRQLAELIVERHPWRAALYARRALAHRKHDDRAWAILALSQMLLGNYRSAVAAYREAIAAAPSNPWYAHNLGHLLDVALADAKRALPWLKSAYDKKSDNSEIVASYVHALARAGQLAEARVVLESALKRFSSRELEALSRWLDQGAPAKVSSPTPPKPAKPAKPAKRESFRRPEERWLDVLDDETAKRNGRQGQKVAEALERGLSHLPFDTKQRARALALAHDVVAEAKRVALAQRLSDVEKQLKADRAMQAAGVTEEVILATPPRSRRKRKPEDIDSLAAAVAYAIVYIDHVPLSQAEVAAPFRVAVGRLRGRFAELRANLDLIPGDRRYASR